MIRIAGSRATGRGHLSKGEPCQDAIAFFRDGDVACVALADGAGSLPYSHFAAEAVTRCISEYIAVNFDDLYSSNTIKERIHNKCIETLKILGIPMSKMACTMLCVAIKNENVILVHVGDGMIINVCDEMSQIMSAPENGESPNKTYFITEYMDLDKMRVIRKYVDAGVYILMSDGTMESLYERKNKKIAPAAIKLGRWLYMAEEDAISDKIRETLEKNFRLKTADDMSIIMISTSE